MMKIKTDELFGIVGSEEGVVVDDIPSLGCKDEVELVVNWEESYNRMYHQRNWLLVFIVVGCVLGIGFMLGLGFRADML